MLRLDVRRSIHIPRPNHEMMLHSGGRLCAELAQSERCHSPSCRVSKHRRAERSPSPSLPIHRLWLGNILAVTGAEEHGAAKSDLSALIPRHSIVSAFKFLTGTSDGPRTGGEMHPSTKFQPCSTLGSLNRSLFGLPAPAYG